MAAAKPSLMESGCFLLRSCSIAETVRAFDVQRIEGQGVSSSAGLRALRNVASSALIENDHGEM